MKSPRALRRVLILLALMSASAGAEQVVFSELMYNPPAGKPEFIEVSNITRTPFDMAKWSFTNGVSFTFPDFDAANAQAHFLQALEKIIVSSADPAATRAAYPSIPANVRVFGPCTGALSNSGERVSLDDKNGFPVCSVSYSDRGHWSRAADGTGHSLVLADEDRTLDDWRVWRASTDNGGSPGQNDPPLPPATFRLNEARFDAQNRIDWVEFRNDSLAAADAAGLFVSSKSDFSDKAALSGSAGAGGYVSFDVSFPASGSGDLTLYLIDGADRVLDSVLLQRVAGRDSMQRFPETGVEWHSSVSATRDAANNPDRVTDVVINEIMADAPSGERNAEYIELYNKGASPIDLSGWRLEEAVDFTFPPGTVIGPGAYLVIAGDAAFLNAQYGGLNAIGDWTGGLRNTGEMIRLLDRFGNPVNVIDYKLGGDWPTLANGLGSSMELVNPDADNSIGTAWRDSDETNKSEFQTFTVAGNYTAASQGGQIDHEMRLWAVGDCHLLLRNLVLRPTTAGAGNIFANPDAVTNDGNNVSGWRCQGTHAGSFSDAEGFHLISDGRGDNKANHADKNATGLSANVNYTLSFEARWISGKPRLIAQTWDNSFGAALLLPIPQNLGTPGAANSTALAAPPPQVADLRHSPPVPNSTQPVVVTARISSAAPVDSVALFHRLDNIQNNAPWNTVPMSDDGAAGDAVAGDGVYSASLTPFPDNSIVQFHVRATAGNGLATDLPREAGNLPAMWAVDNTAIPPNLRTERFVVSRFHLDALGPNGGGARFGFRYPKLSNHYFPCTFISNDSKIFYGAGIRKSGSPFTRDASSALGRGKFKLPADRIFRGREKLYFDDDNVSEPRNRLTRYFLYLFGHPGNENEFVRTVINGDNPNIREDVEPVANELLDRLFQDGAAGQLLRIDDNFAIADDGGTRIANTNGDWGYKGSDDPLRYHNSWNVRTRESEYDYSPFTEWTRQMTIRGTSITEPELERMGDGRYLNIMAAVRGYIADWDSMTLDRGKNGYFYRKSTDGRWMFLHWDSDRAYESDRTGQNVLGSLQGVQTYYNRPFNRRQFDHYLTKMVNEFALNSPRLAAWFAAEESSNTATTVNTGVFNSFFTARRSKVLNDLGPTLNTPFQVTSAPATTAGEFVTIVGRAPSTVLRIEVAGHPETTLIWNNAITWVLQNIRMKEGMNDLVINGVDFAGNVIVTAPVTISKTGDTAPVLAIEGSPKSLNIGLGEPLLLDASSSFDPEGTPLAYSWQVSPAMGVTTSNPLPSQIAAVFSKPGVYDFTVTGTDGAGSVSTLARQVSVFSTTDFESFTSLQLPAGWTAVNVAPKNNFPSGAWYSLTDKPGNLLVQVLNDSAKPLASPNFTHPYILRSLPGATDWYLQTDFKFDTREFGTFQTGLVVEFVEDGQPVRYAFAATGGTSLTVQRAAGAGNFGASLISRPSNTDGATLRIVRSGDRLSFQNRAGGAWTEVLAQTLSAGAMAVQGGIFAATTAPENVRIAFDYLLLGDPEKPSDLVNTLRVTEIMYRPAPGGVEFIELTNFGVAPIDLDGVYFEDTRPFERFTFGALTLDPGGFIVVTADVAAFRSIYGDGPRVAGQFNGSLDNAGERIVLRDKDGNLIQDFTYGTAAPWPVSPNGGGFSLDVASLSGDTNDPANWQPSPAPGGSPGGPGVPAGGRIVINEILSHSLAPFVDAIELHNPTAAGIDIGGWHFSDGKSLSTLSDTRKFRIPDGTSIPPGGYVVFTEQDFNPNGAWNPAAGAPGPNEFAFDGDHGDTAILIEADAAGNLVRFVDRVEFGSARANESWGRWPNGEGGFYPMALQTLLDAGSPLMPRPAAGGANSEPRVGPLVISEVHHSPAGDDPNLEFVEISNPTDAPQPLANRILRGDVEFDFTAETVPAGGSVVVTAFPPADADLAAAFRAAYGIGAEVALAGPWAPGGRLAPSGRVVLHRAEDPPIAEPAYIPLTIEDETNYSSGDPWPATTDGSSLTRLATLRPGDDPAGWTARTPNPGRGFNSAPFAAADSMHLPVVAGVIGIDVLGNDTDADGDPLVITAVTDGAFGTAQTDGSTVTFTPGAAYAGNDSFTYTVSDGAGGSAVGTVSLTNAPPAAADDALHPALAGGAVVLDVRANDADPDGDDLAVLSAGAATAGTTATDGATITFTPGPEFDGNDRFTYVLGDGFGGTATASVMLTNTRPTAQDDLAASDGSAVQIDVLANDADADADDLIVESVTNPIFGTADVVGNQIVYTPDGAFAGDDAFSYTVSDGHGGTALANVTIRSTAAFLFTGSVSGSAVPGMANAVFGSLQVPAIGDDGSLSYAARIRIGGSRKQTKSLFGGIAPVMLFSAGNPVPGVPGATFKKFSDPVSDSAGRTVFIGSFKGSGVKKKKDDTAIFAATDSGEGGLVARAGAPAPDVPGRQFKQFIAVDADRGETLYAAKLTGGKDTGVWAWDGAIGRLVIRSGMTVGSKLIKSVSVLPAVKDSSGQGRSHRAGEVALHLAFSDKTEALALATFDGAAWTTETIAASNQPTGFGGAWDSFGPPALGTPGNFVALCKLGGAAESSDEAVVSFVDGTAAEIAREGSPSPVPGTVFKSFADPIASLDGRIAFTARLDGSPVNRKSDDAIFATNATGELELVARQQEPAADAPGAVWDKFESVALPSWPGAGPVFLATLSGSSVGKANRLGLWAQTTDGRLILLARTGAPMAVGASTRILTKMALLNGLPPVQGSARSYNDDQRVAFLATFTDGSEAIQVFRIP